MTVSLPEKKVKKFLDMYENISKKDWICIQELAEIVGVMVSYSITMPFGPLFIKQLEIEKSNALKASKGSFSASMTLSSAGRKDLEWWAINIQSNGAPISRAPPSLTITTDASGLGWGAVFESGGQKTGGRWSNDELKFRSNINYLELLAVLLGVKSFLSVLSGHHVRLRIDNATAVAYINHMGGTRSVACNEVTRDIWMVAKSNNMWLSAVHLPGVQNCEADKESRVFNDATEWMLNKVI